MILKVATTVGDDTRHWWIYDNIVKFRYTHHFIEMTEEQFQEASYHVMLIYPYTGKSGVKDDKFKFMEVCFRDKYDNEIMLAFDEVAYLCNDDGKTIEKIAGPKIT